MGSVITVLGTKSMQALDSKPATDFLVFRFGCGNHGKTYCRQIQTIIIGKTLSINHSCCQVSCEETNGDPPVNQCPAGIDKLPKLEPGKGS